MTAKQPLPPAGDPVTPEPMPAEGGSYNRLPDGGLQPAAADTTKD